MASDHNGVSPLEISAEVRKAIMIHDYYIYDYYHQKLRLHVKESPTDYNNY